MVPEPACRTFGTDRAPMSADFADRLAVGRRSRVPGRETSGHARMGLVPTGGVPILARVEKRATGRRLAWSTAIFSLATGLSRILGLVREIVAAYYFGAAGKINAFTVAFQ